MKGHRDIHPAFQWLWRSCSQLKHKIFFWLLLKDRLNVRGMLRRKTMYLDDYTCVFCTCRDDETIAHLFLNCPFSQQCWISIGLHIQSNLGPLAVLEDLRRQIAEPFFMEVITLMSWSIWNARNNFIFKNEAFSIQGTKNAFIKEFALVIQRAKTKYFPNIVQWLESQA